MRFWLSILCVAGVAGCGHSGDDARYQFGVSATQPGPTVAAATPPAADLLAWKANQLCTLGYKVVRQDTISAEGGAQIDDNHLQCNPYRPWLDVFNVSWGNLF
jgi:hypothetical protein